MSDTLRLVAEWLETAEAREARRKLFEKTFISREVPGGVQPWKAFRVAATLNNEIVECFLGDVVTQFDRVGSYLERASPDARSAVLDIYALSVARCWLVIGPFVRDLRMGRGAQYGRHFVGLARDALNWMENQGLKEIRLHPFGNSFAILQAPIAEGRVTIKDLETAEGLLAAIAPRAE